MKTVGVFILIALLCLRSHAVRVSSDVAITWDSNASMVVKDSVDEMLSAVAGHAQQIISYYPSDVDLTVEGAVSPGTLVISFGNTATTRQLIPSPECAKLGPEGFIVRSTTLKDGTRVIASDGNPSKTPFVAEKNVNNGQSYGVYRVLFELRYAFVHPLQILNPSRLLLASATELDIADSPRWAVRGCHYHSEHPLEWTSVLNGFGDYLKTDEESWRKRLPELEKLFQYLAAFGQNRFEWILLSADEWKEFAGSTMRQERLKYITTRARLWGIATGADVSICERQQHAWYMVESNEGSLEDQIKQIKQRLEWLFDAGFDFLSTESGTSEFTHPDDVTMLAWINATATLTHSFPNHRCYIKCHCSSSQVCPHYKDPRDPTKQLNFNFLPMLANDMMGVMPHTVQYFDYFDPAYTYGNANFSFMFDFLKYEIEEGKREVLYHGETAYWVSFDIDVPLFLNIYGDSRLRDLTAIAKWEDSHSTNMRMTGTMNFHSGFEWGYWLNEIMNAFASWDPYTAKDKLGHLFDLWFNDNDGNIGSKVSHILDDVIDLEHTLLVFGNWNGTLPNPVRKRTGGGLVAGWDMSSELAGLFDPTMLVQPDRLGPIEVRDPLATPNYSEIKPLLVKMEAEFGRVLNELHNLSISTHPVIEELLDCLNITMLRVSEIHALYDFATGEGDRKQDALDILTAATEVVQRRERNYRVSADYIGGWRNSSADPTAYEYGYLWPVHSLYYWWRDFGQATLACGMSLTPCYLNLYNIEEVAIGGLPGGLNITQFIRDLFDEFHWPERYITDCLAGPAEPYEFPRDLVQ